VSERFKVATSTNGVVLLYPNSIANLVFAVFRAVLFLISPGPATLLVNVKNSDLA
jgi:hypothetical protein